MMLRSLLRLNKKTTAKTAKDRLHIIIAQERTKNSQQDYLPLLRKEILEVIAKYTKVDVEQVKVDLQTNENNSILELNVVLPESMTAPEAAATE